MHEFSLRHVLKVSFDWAHFQPQNKPRLFGVFMAAGHYTVCRIH